VRGCQATPFGTRRIGGEFGGLETGADLDLDNRLRRGVVLAIP
jgi:hypothetical protein